MSQRYAGWRIVFQNAISAATDAGAVRSYPPRAAMSGDPPLQRNFAHTCLMEPFTVRTMPFPDRCHLRI
jgi:hypothetical protein